MPGYSWRHGSLAFLTCAGVLAATASGTEPPRTRGVQQNEQARYHAQDLLPFRESNTTFRFIEGEKEGETESLIMRPHRGEGWVLEIAGYHRIFVKLNDDGDIVLLGEELPSQGYAFRYDPPPVLIPAVVQSGMRDRQSGQVRTYDLSNGGELIHTSTYEQTLKVRGIRLVPASASSDGSLRAVVISTQRSANIGRADIEIDIENAYYPGTGHVYQRTVTDTAGGPFNLWSETSVHTMRYSAENYNRRDADR